MIGGYRIGIIQGRLSPPRDGKIQAFPWASWEKEFILAREIGFDTMGWIFETERWQDNPLFTPAGRRRLSALRRETGIDITYVCADYFMENPFVRVPKGDYDKTLTVLKELVKHSSSLGIRGIELPMVDNARIETATEQGKVIAALRSFIPLLEEYNMGLLIESSLPPSSLEDFMRELSHPLFYLTYDTGNSASLGYDPGEEIKLLHPWLVNIHIKDRHLGGTTVPLGEGNADFDKFFTTLKAYNYQGLFTLQAARAGDPVDNTKKQLGFLRHYIEKYLR